MINNDGLQFEGILKSPDFRLEVSFALQNKHVSLMKLISADDFTMVLRMWMQVTLITKSMNIVGDGLKKPDEKLIKYLL